MLRFHHGGSNKNREKKLYESGAHIFSGLELTVWPPVTFEPSNRRPVRNSKARMQLQQTRRIQHRLPGVLKSISDNFPERSCTQGTSTPRKSNSESTFGSLDFANSIGRGIRDLSILSCSANCLAETRVKRTRWDI